HRVCRTRGCRETPRFKCLEPVPCVGRARQAGHQVTSGCPLEYDKRYELRNDAKVRLEREEHDRTTRGVWRNAEAFTEFKPIRKVNVGRQTSRMPKIELPLAEERSRSIAGPRACQCFDERRKDLARDLALRTEVLV